MTEKPPQKGRSTPPPQNVERARVIAASALALLAILAFLLVIGAPRPAAPGMGASGLDVSDILAFRSNPSACFAMLRQTDAVRVDPIPDARQGNACGWRQGVRLTQSIHPYSQPMEGQCALAAALVVWERDVLVPVAVRRLGARVARIELAAPAYQCRGIAGRDDGRMSEHATANAIDISGFTLVNGRTLTVKDGWYGRTIERQFLREIRNGACGVFQGVLSPEYNAAHRDHLHFDLGRDKMCR